MWEFQLWIFFKLIQATEWNNKEDKEFRMVRPNSCLCPLPKYHHLGFSLTSNFSYNFHFWIKVRTLTILDFSSRINQPRIYHWSQPHTLAQLTTILGGTIGGIEVRVALGITIEMMNPHWVVETIETAAPGGALGTFFAFGFSMVETRTIVKSS